MRSRAAARQRPIAGTVHVVCLSDRVEIFDSLDAARAYAAQDPAAVVRSYPLRRGTDEAILVYNQRVVIREGRTESTWQADVLDFYDEEFQPPEADVEVYEKETGQWHAVGFGTDRKLLDARMAQAVASVSRARLTG